MSSVCGRYINGVEEFVTTTTTTTPPPTTTQPYPPYDPGGNPGEVGGVSGQVWTTIVLVLVVCCYCGKKKNDDDDGASWGKCIQQAVKTRHFLAHSSLCFYWGRPRIPRVFCTAINIKLDIDHHTPKRWAPAIIYTKGGWSDRFVRTQIAIPRACNVFARMRWLRQTDLNILRVYTYIWSL